MNISKENIDALNAVLTIEFEKADYQPQIDKAIKDYGKRVALKGFRPGHAPASMIKKMYGTQVAVDVINKTVGEALTNYIHENNIDLLGEPLPNAKQEPIDFDKELDKLTFRFDLGLAPEVDLTIDDQIAIPAYTITVDDKAVSDQIDNIRSRYGKHESVEAVGEDSLVKGVLEVGELSNEKCVASVSLVKDEAEKKNFVGKKVGEAVSFDIRKAFVENREIAYLLGIKEDEAASVNGAAKLTLTEVTDYKKAELNQELFDQVYGKDEIKDEAAFRDKVKETLAKANAMSEDYRFSVDVRETLMSKVSFDLPEEFLKRWLTVVNKDNDKFSQDVLDNEFPKFLEDLKWQVVKNNIIRKNEIKIEREDVLGYAKKVTKAQFMQYGIGDIPEDQLTQYASSLMQKEDQRSHLLDGAAEDKVVDFVKGKAKLESKTVSQDEFNKLFEK